MVISDENRAIAASTLKFFEEQIKTGGHNDEAQESLAVAIDCINNVFKITGAERTVCLKEAYQTAIKSLPPPKEASAEEKRQAEELKNEGNNLLKDGKLQEAIDAYTKAIDLDGANAVYYSNRAAVYLKLGNNQGALDDCDRALMLDAQYSKAYCRKGVAHMNKDENERARDCFQRAAELEPDNETYKNNLKVAVEKIETQRREAASNLFGGMGGMGGFPDLAGMGIGGGGGGGMGGMPGMFPGMDPSSFLGNPAFMQMASRMMQDPAMQQMMSTVVSSLVGGGGGPGGEDGADEEGVPPAGGEGVPDLSSILRVGQQLAQQMASANPDLIDQLRRQAGDDGGPAPDSGDGKKPDES